MVYYLEPLVSVEEIHGGNIHDALELALRVVPEESEHLNDARRRGVEREFIFQHRELLNVFRETLREVRAELMQRLGRLRVPRQGRVGRRRLGERGGGRCAWRSVRGAACGERDLSEPCAVGFVE